MSDSQPKSPQTSMEIPGAVSPGEGEDWEGGEATGEATKTPGGDKRARIAALMRKRGAGGGAAGAGGGKGQLRERLRGLAVGGAAGGGGAGGRAMLGRVLSQLKERSGGTDGKGKRLIQVLEAVAKDFDKLEADVGTLRAQLADAEEKIRVLTEGDELAGGQ